MKTVDEHKLAGTFQESRHGGRIEAQKPEEIPTPPDHLADEEKELFTAIATLMWEGNSLASLDLYALEVYCVQLCLFRRAKAALARDGEYVTTMTNKAGATNQVPSPWLLILKNSTDAILKLGAKLGLTPNDRGKISKVMEGLKKHEQSLLR